MYYWSSLFFYTLPLPIISLLALFTVFFSKKLWRILMLSLTIVSLSIWIARSYKINTDEPLEKEKGFEIVVWNSQHTQGLKEAIIENGSVPDVFVLVECNKESVKYAELNFPNYYFKLSKEGIGIFSKVPIAKLNEIISEDNSRVLSFKIEDYNFYAVDIYASLLNFRGDSLRFLKSTLQTDENTIVLGDFNTPLESVHLSFLKKNFENSFDEKGDGFRETWFWNIPILSLDHIWVSNDIEIISANKISTFKSDHSMLKTIIKK